MTRNFPLILLFVSGGFVFVSGCKDELPTEDDAASIVFPDSGVSYGSDLQRLFNARCIGCHTGSNPETTLDLTAPSYGKLMNYQPRLVIAFESGNSLLVQRLDGRVSPRMPLIGSAITQNQLAGVKKWIDEGAVNN